MTDDLTDDEIRKMRERCEAATEGPWDHSERYEYEVYGGNGKHLLTTEFGRGLNPEENAEFIANARQDVPALLGEVERLRNQRRLINRHLRDLARGYVSEEQCANVTAEMVRKYLRRAPYWREGHKIYTRRKTWECECFPDDKVYLLEDGEWRADKRQERAREVIADIAKAQGTGEVGVLLEVLEVDDG